MRKSILLIAVLAIGISACAQNKGKKAEVKQNVVETPVVAGEVKKMTGDEFMAKFMTLGVTPERPAVVDFNAEWCGPCKRLEPILNELSVKYSGQIDFYSINVDENKDVAGELGISSIPYMVFIPVDGLPQALTGFYEKDMLEGIMAEFLLGIPSDKVNVTYKDRSDDDENKEEPTEDKK